MSWPTTMADRPDIMRRYWARAREENAVFDPTRSTTLVIAPCCGRRTPADTVVSLEGLVTEIRGGNYRPKVNLDWACDGCRHLLILDPSNDWTWSKLFRALGAPDEVVRHNLARELEHTARKLADGRGEGFNPAVAFEAARESLPLDATTEPELPDV